MDGLLFVYGDTAYMRGVDHGGDGTVIAQSSKAIVIKWPSGTHWVSRGERSYHSATTVVYAILETQNNMFKVELLVDWENTRKKKT